MLVAILVQLDQNPFEVAFEIIYGFQQNQISTPEKNLAYGMKTI